MNRFHEDEQGAVAVMVSLIFAFLVVGLIAVSVDAGSMWASQRDLATDTDGAALAGVHVLALMETEDCQDEDARAANAEGAVYDEVVSVLGANSAASELEEVNVSCSDGTVEVVARTQPDTMVAASVAGTEPTVAGASTAQFRRFLDADFQPLALCNLHVGDDLGALSVPYKWGGQAPAGCDNGANNNNMTGQWGWLLECEAAEAMMCWGENGNNTIQPNNPNSWGVQIGESFGFFIYDYSEHVTGPSPSNRQFHVVGRGVAVFQGCGDTEERPPSPNNCPGNQDWMYLDVTHIDYFDDEDPENLPDVEYSLCAMSGNDQCASGD